MVRHIVAWDFLEVLSAEEKCKHAEQMKKELKKLQDLIPGLISIDLLINHLETSEAELLLDSLFVSEDALKNYSIHPEHVRVANSYIKPVVKNRRCFDVIVES